MTEACGCHSTSSIQLILKFVISDGMGWGKECLDVTSKSDFLSV